MSELKPFLFLDSPRVGDIGHAYVVVPGEPTPAEAVLTFLATKARNSPNDIEGAITASHRVKQIARGMEREGEELLICGGAKPSRVEDAQTVEKVLNELLGDLPRKEEQLASVKRVGPLITAGAFMTALSEKFHRDARVREIQWRPIEIAVKPTTKREASFDSPSSAGRLTLWRRFKRSPMPMKLILMLGLIYGCYALVGHGGKPPVEPPGGRAIESSTVIQEPENLKKWDFLRTDDWRRLMEATGGKKLYPDLAQLVIKADVDAKRKEEGTFFEKGKKWISGGGDATPGLSAQDLNRMKALLIEIEKWSKILTAEFELKVESTPQALQAATVPKFLMAAKEAKGGNEDLSVAAWFKDFKNQRGSYPPDFKKNAELLDDFSSVLGNPPPEQLPQRLREITKALDTFSTSTGVAQGPFRDLWKKQSMGIEPPRDDYEVLTAIDAKRIAVIQNVLGSKDFAAIIFTRPESLGSDQTDWKTIRGRIDDGITLGKIRASNDPSKILLLILGKAFNLDKSTGSGAAK